MLDQTKYIVRAFLLIVILLSGYYIFSSITFSRPGKFYCGTVDGPCFNADTSIDYKNGKTLYLQRCASCHSLDKDIVGPALMGLTKRGPWINKKNVWRYLQDPIKFYRKDTTGYMKALWDKYPARSTAFIVSEKEVNDIVYYIETEEKNRKGRNH